MTDKSKPDGLRSERGKGQVEGVRTVSLKKKKKLFLLTPEEDEFEEILNKTDLVFLI